MSKPQTAIAKQAERVSRPRQRQKLIEACITALYQHGPSRTTIDKVVSIANMSPGIVNFYFETKAALLIAALEYLAVEFEESVLAPLAALRDTPIQALERLIELYLDEELASARKVSVWYAFWGESSSRKEYFTICGKRDLAFAELVRDLVGRLIWQNAAHHLDADAIALGLIGALEMMWQDIAFQDEADIDRGNAKRRCRAYLSSVFPNNFGSGVSRGKTVPSPRGSLPGAAYASQAQFAAELDRLFHRRWLWLAHENDLPQPGDYVTFPLGDQSILGVRAGDRAIGAFTNLCTHRPHLLATKEEGNFGADIKCAVHGLSFGLDGARVAADRSSRLAPHVVAQAGEAIFVLAGDGQAVGPTVGLDPRLAQPLQPLGRWAISDLQADWKLVVEHWADVYLHPSGAARSFLLGDKTTIAVSESETGATWRQTLQGDASCWAAAKYVQLAATRPGEGAPMIIERRILWPSIMIEFRPDGITLRQVLPRGPGRSTLRVRRYAFAPATREIRVLNYLAFRLERVWAAEDLAILESTQAGVTQLTEQVDQAGETLTASFWAWLRAACPREYDN